MINTRDVYKYLVTPKAFPRLTDPMASFVGQWVYYVHLYNVQKANDP